MKRHVNRLGRLFGRWMANFQKHEIPTRSASIAYTITLSLAPLVLLLLSVFSWMSPAHQAQVYVLLDEYIGPAASEVVQIIAANTENNPNAASLSGLIGLLILLFSASTLFVQLRDSMNVISGRYSQDESYAFTDWLKDRFTAIAVVFGFILVSVLSVAINSAVNVYFEGDQSQWVGMLAGAVDFLIFLGLFIFLYMAIPSRRLSKRTTLLIAFITAVLFNLAKYALSLYLTNSSFGSSYGAAGSLVVILFWGYASAAIILSCYELGCTLSKMNKTAHHPTAGTASANHPS